VRVEALRHHLWAWAVKSLSADLNLNMLKDTYDYSYF
jgi:hypothetical protein